jgi:hypothetical protein
METSTNLWPDFTTVVTRSPKTVLKEQANFLGERTKNVIVAKVTSASSLTDEAKEYFIHSFNLFVPSLRYKYELFSVAHKVSPYPCTISYYGDSAVIFNAVGKSSINDEQEFLKVLRIIFSDQETTNIISSLLSMVEVDAE